MPPTQTDIGGREMRFQLVRPQARQIVNCDRACIK